MEREGDGGVGGDGGGDVLATHAAAVCVGGGRLTEADCHSRLAERSDGGDGGVGGDSGGDALGTHACAAVCVDGGRLTEADWHCSVAEMSDGGDGGDGGVGSDGG